MLYSIGFFIFSVFYLPTLIFKGRLHGDFAERFARFDGMKKRELLSGRDRIWIQAVSVGEVALCKSLIPALKEIFPGRDIVISTVTKTGQALAKKNFSKDAIIIYFPLDFLCIVKKAIGLIKPSLYIMIETELWPNLLKAVSAGDIPCILINGRISDRSIGKYRLVKPFLKKALGAISAFCMQDDIDAERIIELGAPRDRVTVTGNMKFDASVPGDIKDPGAIRASLGLKDDDELIVAGSTHEGEEAAVLEAFKKLSVQFPKIRLLVAPRHIDRAEQIERTIRDAGFEVIRFSTNDERRLSAEASAKAEMTNDERRIILLDTIGHLNDAYSVATIVFVGGSLIRHGGQNPIEPAYFAKPVLFGPHMFNFKYIAGVLLKYKPVMQVFSGEDLYEKFRLLLADPALRSTLGERARKVVNDNRGATGRNIARICGILRVEI